MDEGFTNSLIANCCIFIREASTVTRSSYAQGAPSHSQFPKFLRTVVARAPSHMPIQTSLLARHPRGGVAGGVIVAVLSLAIVLIAYISVDPHRWFAFVLNNGGDKSSESVYALNKHEHVAVPRGLEDFNTEYIPPRVIKITGSIYVAIGNSVPPPLKHIQKTNWHTFNLSQLRVWVGQFHSHRRP